MNVVVQDVTKTGVEFPCTSDDAGGGVQDPLWLLGDRICNCFKLCRLFSVLLTLLLNVFCSKASVFPEAPAPPASLARLDFLDRTVRYDLLFALILRLCTCTRFVVFVGFISQPAGIRR